MHWEKEERENEAEHGWTKRMQPKWKANAVRARGGMEAENTEEKVLQFVANVTTRKSNLGIFRNAGEVNMGGHEDESERYEESRSGDGEQESTKLYSKEAIQKDKSGCWKRCFRRQCGHRRI